MGGYDSGRGLTPEELKKLQDLAKKDLKGAIPSKRSVYISFDAADLGEVNLLRAQAKNEKTDLEFVDRSLKEPFNSENIEYIKRGIRERIKQCSVTVVYLTESTWRSKWVDWEIRESNALGKGVIAMYKGDTPPKKMPKAIGELSIKIVPWNHDLLSKGIDDAARKR